MIVRVDHKLRIDRKEIPSQVENSILEALSIPNMERQKAMEQNLWGWKEMPRTIDLWRHVKGELIMPRGFLSSLLKGLAAYGVEYELNDQRVHDNDLPMPDPIDLHSWQEPAVRAIRMFEQGIWKAPAGSGKTVGVLEAIRRCKGPSIVLVNTKDILWQWQDRAKKFLGAGFPLGQIGDNVFEISPYLTIATAQTLHSRYDRLVADGFFDYFSFVCLDECHHATAETYNRLVNRFSARYRIGVSATPDKTGDFDLAINVLGPIFHETHRKDVESIVAPEIFKVSTNFSFKFKRQNGKRPSNYPQLLAHLISDPERNALIVKSLMINEGAHALVVSKRIEHLEILKERLVRAGYSKPILMMTGDTSNEDRQAIVGIAKSKPCVILSTLADEALDIPRLDSLFLVYPQRNPGLIEQQVGRICRSHPGKERPQVFDFADPLVGPLDSQWKSRRSHVYRPHGYDVTQVSAEHIMAYEIGSDE
jgi:superfamily II DNA or RNA helicase